MTSKYSKLIIKDKLIFLRLRIFSLVWIFLKGLCYSWDDVTLQCELLH